MRNDSIWTLVHVYGGRRINKKIIDAISMYSEANASEFLENLTDIFPVSYIPKTNGSKTFQEQLK